MNPVNISIAAAALSAYATIFTVFVGEIRDAFRGAFDAVATNMESVAAGGPGNSVAIRSSSQRLDDVSHGFVRDLAKLAGHMREKE